MYEDISRIPYTVFDGKSVLHRLVCGLGHRFHKASIGLAGADLSFRPTPQSMSLQELLNHIRELVDRSTRTVGGASRPLDGTATPERIIAGIAELEQAVIASDFTPINDDLFYIISGPVADAISHIGQINTYKRMMGIAGPNSRYYKGLPA